jgi:hypothetical protein
MDDIAQFAHFYFIWKRGCTLCRNRLLFRYINVVTTRYNHDSLKRKGNAGAATNTRLNQLNESDPQPLRPPEKYLHVLIGGLSSTKQHLQEGKQQCCCPDQMVLGFPWHIRLLKGEVLYIELIHTDTHSTFSFMKSVIGQMILDGIRSG